METNSKDMILTLPEGKKNTLVEQCQILLRKRSLTLKEITHVIGSLESTAVAVLPASLQYRGVQRQQVLEFSMERDYNSQIELTEEVKVELNCLVQTST